MTMTNVFIAFLVVYAIADAILELSVIIAIKRKGYTLKDLQQQITIMTTRPKYVTNHIEDDDAEYSDYEDVTDNEE